MNRRKFIGLSSLASASIFIPGFVGGVAAANTAPVNGRKLVVLQLSGGNDGLNTIIPVRNDIYYRSRPGICVKASDAFCLTDELGLHPAMPHLRNLFHRGALSVLNGVGYERPDRSHAGSTAIWQSGRAPGEGQDSGWLGRYLDEAAAYGNRNTSPAIGIGEIPGISLQGAHSAGLLIPDPGASQSGFGASGTHTRARYFFQTPRVPLTAAHSIDRLRSGASLRQSYPDTAIGKRLGLIASLILSGTHTSVFSASHGGFDTHAGQRGRHDKLLSELDSALAAFTTELEASGRFKDVLIMTVSVFGRRVAENGSGGTDHGTAAPMFMISGGLQRPGIYNPVPSLEDLDEGDLRYSIDFRAVYATVVSRWLGMPHLAILDRAYEPLTFI